MTVGLFSVAVLLHTIGATSATSATEFVTCFGGLLDIRKTHFNVDLHTLHDGQERVSGVDLWSTEWYPINRQIT